MTHSTRSDLKAGLVTAFHGERDEMLTVGREKVRDSWLIGQVEKVSGSPYIMMYCQPQKKIYQNAMVGFDFIRKNAGLPVGGK